MSSKTISVFSFFFSGDAVGEGDGDGEACGAGGRRSCGFSWRKRSRNWSSRKRGVRSFRSTRATTVSSVLWLESKSRKLPSGLHATVFALEFARKLTGQAAPPPTETTLAFVYERCSGA